MSNYSIHCNFNCRADYWKSQDRKYCDFCKCWIADNRPSVEFHEKGRRHQENVKKRLRNITKNSERAQKESDKMDATLKKMEKAALDAYRKDVANNADLTSVAINKKLEDDNLAISGGSKKLWNEVKAPDGNIYFWNTVTSETVWEPPTEGYVSLKEQEEEKCDESKKHFQVMEKMRQRDEKLKYQKQEKNEMEEKAKLAREKMKERRVVDETSIQIPVVSGPILDPGPTNPYGRWQTIKEKPVIDYQLPEQAEYFEAPVELEPEPVVKEFKEKTVESIEILGGETSFKKRKFGGAARRNQRQRLDDD